MENKNLIISLIMIVVVFLLGIYFIFVFSEKEKILDIQKELSSELSPEEIMEIIKTDKDYNDLSDFIKDFEPGVANYIKLGQNEYRKIRLEWQEQDLGDRIGTVDKINLTDFTYWIELKNKKDETKGLRMVLDVKERKSLLLIASLSIKVGVGL